MNVTESIPVPDELILPGRPPLYPFRSMAVGSSFPIEDDKLHSVRSAVWRQNKNGGTRRFLVSKHKSAWRCWRTA